MRVGVSSAAPRLCARRERRGIGPAEPRLLDDAADQRKAVRMKAGRGEAEHDVAGREVAARQKPLALDRADGEAGEVVVAAPIEARHLGRLAADQRRAGHAAALGDALDDVAAVVDVERAGGEIVEEEERLGALHDEVVDAHRDEVDADRAVLAALDGDLQLGADAVGRRDEDRVAEAGRLQVEERAEAAEPAEHAGRVGRRRGGLDPLHQAVAGVDIDAGVAIGQGIALLAHCRLAPRVPAGGLQERRRPRHWSRAGAAGTARSST